MDQVLQDPLPGAPRPLAFSVLRVPFFLEPDYREDMDYVETNRERLIKKWGGVQGWNRQKQHHDLKGRGLAAGIPHFNLDRKAASTMASHRLIQYIGKKYGLYASEAVYDMLNVYYFVEGHSLNDRPRLAQAVRTTLAQVLSETPTTNIPTEQELSEFLQSNQGRAEIEQALQALQQLGIHSIPKFIIEGTTVIDGAAHSDVFVKVFRDIERRGTLQRGTPIFADILGISTEMVARPSHVRASISSS